MLEGEDMSQPTFRYIRFRGRKLNPESFRGREPTYNEVYGLYTGKQITIDLEYYVPVEIKVVNIISTRKGEEVEGELKEIVWISRKTYEQAGDVFSHGKIHYYAHEGVSFDVARGTWKIIGSPKPVGCPPGYDSECVLVETELSKEIGMDPFIVERKFVFKGISGEHIKRGKVDGYAYLVLAFDRDKKRFLTEDELMKTLLYRNYLSRAEVRRTLESSSKHMRKDWWFVERMRGETINPFKVVWRDVAKEFIPAVDIEGAVPDHNVHYVVTNSLEEACYLMAVLLAPQINAVVRELSPWIGHVQPRFLRYFGIPQYNPINSTHKGLASKGMAVLQKGYVDDEDLDNIELLVKQLK